MNTVLLILGLLGFGAILIAAYVFTVAARNYVSDENASADVIEAEGERRLYVVRSNQDRRKFTGNTGFPLTLSTGQVIPFERRASSDRRVANG